MTYKKTALVLGAGGFIGSHMVKRLRSEGYWVRGVDLKYPEYSKTQANEFVQGDLRDVHFVKRVLEFKGYSGNFFNSVPYQHIEPFDEIYQFAADMGGAGFVFTGENDADIMHNSVSINLNVLEEQRKLNETFSGEKKDRTEANRPKLLWKTKIFYSGSACMYPEHNQLDPNNPDCREESAYPLTQIPNMDGKNFSRRGYISLIIVTTVFLLGLLVTITSSGLKERGKEEGKKLPLPSAERLPTLPAEMTSRYGEMGNKLDPSYTSTNVLKQPDDSWIQNSLAQ